MGVILVRHPETIDPRVIAGQSDVALAPHALASIDSLAASLPAARRIVSSDLSRCRLLAEALEARCGVACEFDARWREQSFGEWEGKRWDEVDGRAYLESWTTATPPGGESIVDVQARVAAALAELAPHPPAAPSPRSRGAKDARPHEALLPAARGEGARSADEGSPNTLVITHAGPIRCALAHTRGLPIEEAFAIAVAFGSWRSL